MAQSMSRCAVIGAASLVGLAGSAVAQPWQPMQRVCYFGESADGSRGFGRLLMPVENTPAWPNDRLPVAGVETIYGDAAAMSDGPFSPNRYIFVIVGDGYQAAQLGTYATHTTTSVNALLAQEPFKTYAPYFTFHRVDVVSTDSGVDNDPTFGILKNTALDMNFWCSNIERLLCVNTTKAYQFANNAPQAPDQVLAIANSTKYGGAGYAANNLGTTAGGNGSAAEITIHELGHSMGDLADEYDYADGVIYAGGEPSAANASKQTAALMSTNSTKWFRWLNVNDPAWDGLVSSYEGAVYAQFGAYRPTNNSKMRSLGRPFNLPSAEALISEIYRKVRPIDSSTPNGATLTGKPTLVISVLQPVNNPLSIQWTMDGVNIPGATGTSLNLATVSAAAGLRQVGVRVVDNTPWVRDPAIRSSRLTQTITWNWSNVCYANCDGSTAAPVLGAADFSCFLNRYRAGDSYANCDGSTAAPVLGAADFSCFLNRYRGGC